VNTIKASQSASASTPEWPTLGLFLGCYLLWAGSLWAFLQIGYWVLPLIIVTTAFHSSLQHEVLHGHPTRSATLNEFIASPAIGIWFPYRRYRVLHLRHHNNERLTDPLDDPESWYLLENEWSTLGPIKRRVLELNGTLLGRLLIGPWIGFWRYDIKLIISGDDAVINAWSHHVFGLIPILIALVLADFPILSYVFFVAYPATSLILLRSFIEHRAAMRWQARSAIVKAGRAMSLLYLNNNLHAIHHNEPSLAWYRLPKKWIQTKDEILKKNDGYLIEGGYFEVFQRWLLHRREPVLHPLPESIQRAPKR